jgi:hypothetical protein
MYEDNFFEVARKQVVCGGCSGTGGVRHFQGSKLREHGCQGPTVQRLQGDRSVNQRLLLVSVHDEHRESEGEEQT